ncbi:uncharacterized protein LOC132698635 [Cylas formicarius]|uniref:uncharacterized protein LOC132698635 n=1 Tax=Cylas formicarius TaxID=197179 RepID=UPI002958B165|nr:uncharacterized protein LOC132698635 [Cylas formicarius]
MAVCTIPEFYKNRHVFVTGASGFLGKVLIEKLLRSCPEIGNIYILVRPKKGKTLHERVSQITNTPLFDIIKQQNPDAIKKLVPLNGDARQLDLGLSETDKQLIIDQVSLIFHAAASVRFDDSLKEATLINVKSALEISKIALEVKNLVVFQHVSTTYCNIDKKVVEEVLYPSCGHWKELLTLVEKCDEKTLETLTPKYIDPFPNTYTFAKLLAEHVINDVLAEKVPTVIFRPSVVISAVSEPVRGWIDSFNGPCGLLVAGGKGILRIVYGDRSVNTDYVSVDNTVKLMVAATWEKHVLQKKNTLTVSIYNGSKYNLMPVELGEIVDMGKQLYWDVPFETKLWFPRNKMTKCWYEYYFNVLLFHLLPAMLIDTLLKIIGHKPILFKIQRKIYIANMAVSHFMLNEWEFVNTNSMALNKKILDVDEEAFTICLPKDPKAMSTLPTIPEYYENRDVFLTGGTGFIGKCLIEKLLRSCPNIGHIYVLIRSKKGMSLKKRLDNLLSSPLFEVLKEQNPDIFKKLIPVAGDVKCIRLGLSTEDWNMLKGRVSVIFHAAASVRFDDDLRDAILVNVRSAREIAQLSLEITNLEALVHVSTTYCNVDKKTSYEKLYPSHGNWREAITLAEECDERLLEILSPKYTNQFPNTYTFTKLLAEHVINDLCVGKVPTVIFRPSIVLPPLKEPYRGYVDNFNGPVGLLVAGGAGILRIVYGDTEVEADYVCADSIVKAIIVSAWDKAVRQLVFEYKQASDFDSFSFSDFPENEEELYEYYKDCCNNARWYLLRESRVIKPATYIKTKSCGRYSGMAVSTIPEFYANKDVFITGGSGFVGKCLIEKLLRSCPDVGNLYLLLRSKKGKPLLERVEELISSPLFQVLIERNPKVTKKIIPLSGDVTKPNLGLSERDRELLKEKISVFFHAAASVRFDDGLKDAMFVNVRSTRDVAALALEMKQLKVLVHVSTTFCQIDKKIIEEKLYPPHTDWKEAIRLAEECDENVLEILTTKYTSPFPNTYTFTKSLAEHVINDTCVGKIPTVIYRPSIVIPPLNEPVKGYVENFNGPVGLLVAGGSGILRVGYGNGDSIPDYVTADVTVKSLIVASWAKGTSSDNKRELMIINGSKDKLHSIRLNHFAEMGKRLYWDIPFENKLWFPGNRITKCWYDYYVSVLILHMMPAAFVDLILRLLHRKPRLSKMQRKIYISNMALGPFMLGEWEFQNTRFLELNSRLSKTDEESFAYVRFPNLEEIYDYYRACCDYSRWYLLKESKEIKPQTRVFTKRLYLLDRTIRFVFVVLIGWLLLRKMDVV